MTNSRLAVFSVVLFVCAVASLIWQRQTIRTLESERATLREGLAEMESLLGENARLAKAQVGPAELERLRKGELELPRLRGEVSQLRRRLKEEELAAAKQLAGAKATPPAVAHAEQPLGAVETYLATTRANIAANETLVTGGWTTPGGGCALLFITPQVMEGAADQPGQVQMEALIIEAPESVLIQLGLDGLKSEPKQTSSRAILTTERIATALKTLENTPGVDILTAPRILTLDGRQAQVKVGQSQVVAGEVQELGPLIDLMPRISADRSFVDLTVVAQLRLQSSPAR